MAFLVRRQDLVFVREKFLILNGQHGSPLLDVTVAQTMVKTLGEMSERRPQGDLSAILDPLGFAAGYSNWKGNFLLALKSKPIPSEWPY
jgi:hypothetical protein